MALNRIFLNFAKSCILLCLLNVDNIKKIHRAVFDLCAPKAVIKGVLASNTVVMATYYVTKIKTCSTMVGPFLDTMIVGTSDKEGL